MHRLGIIGVGIGLVLSGAGCSSGSSNATGTAATSTTSPANPAAVAPVPSSGCGTSSVRAGETKETLAAPAGERWYFRHVPPAHDGTTPVPLVLDLHGYSEGATVHQLMSGLGGFGDEHGFVTITPQGTGPVAQWDTALDGPDVKFVGDLLDTVEEQLCVDTMRIYVTGLSNGAFMTSAVACAYSERVAAVAPVAGVRDLPGCHFDRAVPIVAFHGTADGYVSFEGGLGEKGLDLPAPDGSGRSIRDVAGPEQLRDAGGTKSVPEIMQAWGHRNGCGRGAKEHSVAADVVEVAYDCPPAAATELYRIEGGGHSWPGSDFSVSIGKIVGKTTTSVSADEIMWKFFVAHPLRTTG